MDEKDPKEVLVLGGGIARQVAQSMFPDANIDVGTYKIAKKNRKKYDAIVSFNALQILSFRDTVGALQDMLDHLNPKGQVYVYVPSMEWIAEQVIEMEPSKNWRTILFGSQKTAADFHKNVFTMKDLRNIFESAGLDVIYANHGSFMWGELEVGQHLVIGVRHGETASVEEHPSG